MLSRSDFDNGSSGSGVYHHHMGSHALVTNRLCLPSGNVTQMRREITVLERY